MARRVAVSGIGLVSAAGLGIQDAWRRIRSAPPQPLPFAGPPPTDKLTFLAYPAVPYDLADAGVPPACVRWMHDEGLAAQRDLKHLLAATALALTDAGLPVDCSAEDPPTAVVVGDESPGFEELSRTLFGLGQAGPLPASPAERYDLLARDFFRLNSFLLPHYVARAFHCCGLSLFVNSACTSGLNALEVAAQEIRAGRSRIALAAASDDPLSTAKFLWFDRLGLYSPDGVIRPFDRDARGTLFGDGGAAVVLEDLDSARARGAHIYAEYLGAAFAQDGWKVTVPRPVPLQAAKALRRALDQAGVSPADVDLMVPHGVGSPASDQYEAAVLHDLWGGGRWPLVTALKPLLGHNLGGSALLELAFLMQSLAAGQVPPTLGYRTPLRRHPVPLADHWLDAPLRTAVKLTCGFAGYYGAAVFRRLDPAEPPR